MKRTLIFNFDPLFVTVLFRQTDENGTLGQELCRFSADSVYRDAMSFLGCIKAVVINAEGCGFEEISIGEWNEGAGILAMGENNREEPVFYEAVKNLSSEKLRENVRLMTIPDLVACYLTGALRCRYAYTDTDAAPHILCPIINSGELYGFLKSDFTRRRMNIPVFAGE